MATFREVFCRKYDCPADEFERRVFSAVSYPHVRLLSALGAYASDFFASDRALIAYCAILQSPRQVADEVRDFGVLRENRRFARRVLLLRVSGRRLQRLVAECFESPSRVERANFSATRPPASDRTPRDRRAENVAVAGDARMRLRRQ